MASTTTPLEMNRPLPSWTLVLWWVLANAVGFGMVGAGFHFPGDFRTDLAAFEWGPALFGLAIGAVTGVLVGLLHWIVFRRHLARAGWWVLTTALGIGVTHGLNDAMPYSAMSAALIMISSGFFIGLIQWLHVRGQVKPAAWWIAASAASWPIAWLAGLAVVESLGLFDVRWSAGVGFQQHGLFSVVFGLVYGAITGITLLLMLRRRQGQRTATLQYSADNQFSN